MSYNGSGNYALPTPPYPAVAGEIIKAEDWNNILSDIASALSLVLVRDGQAPMTGNLHMGTKRITNLADGITGTDAVTYGQVLTAAILALKALTPAADKFPFFTSGSTADMLTIVAAIRTVLASADVATMRTNMGVAYGTTAGTVSEGNHTHAGVYQPSDAELTALAGLTSAADSFPYFTGSGTASLLAIVSAVRTVLASADLATFRSNAGLAIGSDVQAYDATILKSAAIGVTVQGYDADTMKSDVVTARTRSHRFTPVAVTAAAGGALSIDCDLHEACTITLAETTTTVGAASNQARDKYVVLEITGTTGKALAWNTNWQKDGAACTIAAPANGVTDLHCFRSNGTNMKHIGSKLAV